MMFEDKQYYSFVLLNVFNALPNLFYVKLNGGLKYGGRNLDLVYRSSDGYLLGPNK